MAENDAHPSPAAEIDDEHARTYRMFVKMVKYAAIGSAGLLVFLALILR